MAKFRTHYDNLKVSRNAPDSVIKAAYKALCQSYHPDKFQGSKEEAERIIKLINASYAVLIDPVQRAIHDTWIRKQEEKCTKQSEKEEEINRSSEGYQAEEFSTFKSSGNDNSQQKSQLKPTYHWRRLFARSFDNIISGILVTFIAFTLLAFKLPLPKLISETFLANNFDDTATAITWNYISAFFWIIFEPIFLSFFGTTPGKALFSLKLISINAQPKYFQRSLAVWAFGTGFALPFLSFLLILVSGIRLKQYGQTDWDRWTGFQIKGEKLNKSFFLLLIIIWFCIHLWAIDTDPIMKNNNTLKHNSHTNELTYKMQQSEISNDDDLVDQAQKLYDLGHYAKVFSIYQQLADHGHAVAQYKLGDMYFKGQGVKKDYTQAIVWFSRAANQGVASSQFRLGEIYANGVGVVQDINLATIWFRKSVEQGYARSHCNLNTVDVSVHRCTLSEYGNKAIFTYSWELDNKMGSFSFVSEIR